MVSRTLAFLSIGFAFGPSASAHVYAPPPASRQLLSRIDFSHAAPVSEAYRAEFTRCDGLFAGGRGKDTFLGHRVPRPCSTDPSRVKALLKLPDGGILWDSKMALDVDGSYAATSGKTWRNSRGEIRNTTDQCGTTHKWSAVPGGNDCAHPEAQVDPDVFPYVVIPAGDTRFLPRAQRVSAGRQFRTLTGLKVGDMGVVIYDNRWSPAFIADTGPIFRLGEGSSGLFRALGQSRCRGDRFDAGGRCVGDGSERYPYSDSGIESEVIFIFYPGTSAGLTKATAIQRMCDHARTRLGLDGASVCGR
jgi:Fungal chitosanase of glycosyl hydrolase group 75